jgi:hypothetical protein
LKRSATPLVCGSATKAKLRRHTPELDRVEEVIGGVLRAVVHTQNQPTSGIGAGGAKLCLEALGDRLQGREAVADLDRMDANAKGIVVIDRQRTPTPNRLRRSQCACRRCPTSHWGDPW